jgi:hypothetical protein
MAAANRHDRSPGATSAHWTRSPLIVALMAMTIAAAILGYLVANEPATTETAAAAEPAGSSATEARPSPAPLPNDGWFIPAPAGMRMEANELIEDADRLALYLDDAEAEAILDAGFRRVRMRSYYAGASGGGAFTIMEVDDQERLLRRLRRVGDEPGEPYLDLPEASIHSSSIQMEGTRAHDVFAHFRTITFLSVPYVVQIEAYAVKAPVAQRRAETYARSEHELLQSRR